MKRFSLTLKEHFKSMDYFILFSALGMTLLGIITLAGASNVLGSRFAFIQTLTAGLGLVMMLIISFFDYEELINRFWGLFLLFSIGALVIVMLFGTSPDGTQNNWIEIPGFPVNIQPSEFVKISYIIVYAKHIARVKDKINHIKNVIFLALHAGLILALLLLTGDLGSALVYMFITLAMLFSAGLSLWYFAALALFLVIVFPYVWPHLAEYQQMRILCGFNPDLDPVKYGYNAIKSREAIASGGIWGKGLEDASAYRLISREGSYNDFIFGIFGEMFGFIGCAVLILTYIVLIWRIVHIARTTRKDLGGYLCFGVAAVLFAQTVENLGMCLAMLPVVGITLPFMSYGGSSMLASYMMLGIVHSVNAQRNKYYFERESG